MNRKEFIKQTFLGSSAAIFLPTLISCNDLNDLKPIVTSKKIIIIGGGIAGLSAASKLKLRGIDSIIIEAQSKVGGRIKTDYSNGFAFDEGASWIHTPNGNPITLLAKSANANTFLTDENSLEVFDYDKTKYSDFLINNAYKEYDSAIKNVIKNGNINQSFESVFGKLYPNLINDRLWMFLISANLEFDIGGDIADFTSIYLDDDEIFKGDDVIITNGYDKIPAFLAKDLTIKLNEKVIEIDYTSNKTLVKTNLSSYEADYVIVTVPLGVLKNNSLNFSPKLPLNKLQAINSLKMGVVNKFLLLFPNIFWDNSVQYVGYTPDVKGKFNFFMNVKKFQNQNALITYAFGKYAISTESMADSQVINEIMLHLKNIYGESIPNPSKMIRTQWGKNVFSNGSYSYVATGTSSEDYNVLSESINNKLFFAGEHTSKDYRASVHGAYLSGEREAEKIINLINK